jgi:hypothetical protein
MQVHSWFVRSFAICLVYCHVWHVVGQWVAGRITDPRDVFPCGCDRVELFAAAQLLRHHGVHVCRVTSV